MKIDKYRFTIGMITLFMSSIYFIYQGINYGVVSNDEVVKINTQIIKIIEKPNKRKQSLHYTFFCKGFNNEFFVAPDYTKMFFASSLQNEISKNPNQNFEIGIKKSSKSKLNNEHRIDIYSIETENDYFLNINRVIKKNKGLRKSQTITGIAFLIIGVFLFLKYRNNMK